MASNAIGEQAVVIGGGMGGLAAAGALANHFEKVVVLERDFLRRTSASGLERHNAGTFTRCWLAASAPSANYFPRSNTILLAPGRCRFVSPPIFAWRFRVTTRSHSAISAGTSIRCRVR